MSRGQVMSEVTTEGAAAEVYARLGLRRVINAADTYTELGGAQLPAEVAAAIADAGRHQIDLPELMAAAGRRVAELTRNPAALFVSGAAAGVAVTVAAAIAGRDAEDPLTLAEASSAGAREVVVLCCQRNPYDRMIEAAGGVTRQVGFSDSTPIGELRRAVAAPTTAAVLWFAGAQFERHSPPLEEVAEIARAAGVPLIVDAAAQFPPFSNLWTYRERGADLVIFSGGKGLKGPQSSGLVVGDAGWVAASARNAFPHHAIGRAMKTSKENIVGLLAAVERASHIDEREQHAGWMADLEAARARLGAVPGLELWIDPTGRQGQECPRLFLRWDPERSSGRAGARLVRLLAEAEPSIRLGTGEGGPHAAWISPMSLLPGEIDGVTDAVLTVFDEEGN